MDAQGHEQSWKVETIDLKYKEYIEALISYDKRTEQALLSSVGLDAAISAVDKGQWEAARSLGLPQKSIIRRIILPQAMRIAVAPLGNVIIDMVKSSSLAAMITVPDIFQNAKIIGGREYDYMSMYILIALIYWTLSFTLELLQGYLEKRLATYWLFWKNCLNI